jgi:hypothetical protein
MEFFSFLLFVLPLCSLFPLGPVESEITIPFPSPLPFPMHNFPKREKGKEERAIAALSSIMKMMEMTNLAAEKH